MQKKEEKDKKIMENKKGAGIELSFQGKSPSIVAANELNYCVREGNRWDLIAIDTGWESTKSTLKTK